MKTDTGRRGRHKPDLKLTVTDRAKRVWEGCLESERRGGEEATGAHRRSRPFPSRPLSPLPTGENATPAGLRAGERVGITVHVASILGSWGATSPIYFPSPSRHRVRQQFPAGAPADACRRIRGYAVVNPNFQRHALSELARCLDAGMVGIKLAASRRADDPLLDPICRVAVSAGCRCSTTSGNTAGGIIPDRRRATRSSSARWPPGIPASTSCWRTSVAAVTGSTHWRRPGSPQCVRRPVRQRGGWRNAGGVRPGRRCGAAGLGL